METIIALELTFRFLLPIVLPGRENQRVNVYLVEVIIDTRARYERDDLVASHVVADTIS